MYMINLMFQILKCFVDGIFSSPERKAPGELIGWKRCGVVVMVHNVQISSPLKSLGQSEPNFMRSILRKREQKFI